MPQTAVTMPDGSVQSVDNDRIPELVAAGATPPEFVRISLPTGAESEVPWDTYVALSQQRPGELSLTSQDSIDSQAHLADLENDTSTAGAFGRNLLEQASFGLIKPSGDQQLADSHYHGTASTVGGVVGAVGPLLVPGLGEAGLLGRGAELANVAREGASLGRTTSAVGRLGVEMLPGRMAGQLGAAVYEAAGGGLKGVLAGGAIEGAGAEVLRSVLDRDHRLSGESLLDAAGMNALGAGVGYGVAKGISAAEEAFGKLGKRASKAASKVDDAEIVARLEANRPLTAKQLGSTDDAFGKELQAHVAQDIPLYNANRELGRDATRMLKEVEGWRSSAFGKMSPEVAPVIDRGIESLGVLKTFAAQEPAVQSRVMGAYESHLHNVDEMASVLSRTPGGFDVARTVQRWRPENVAARQEAIAKLDATGLAPAEFAAKRLGARMTVGTGRPSAAKDVEGGLLSRIMKGNDRRGRDPMMSLVILDTILQDNILGSGLKLAGVAAGAKAVTKVWENTGRGIALSGLAAENLAKLGLGGGGLSDDRGHKAAVVAQRIKETTPDDARRMASEASKHVAKVSPDTLVSIGDAAANRHVAVQARINEIFPAKRGAVAMAVAKATPTQVRDLERTLAIAGDPTAFAKLLGEGKLSTADLQLAKTVWPAHVQRATQLASNWVAENQGNVPRSTAKRLEMLLGPDAVGQVHEDSFLAAQQSIMAAKARLKAQPTPTPGPQGGSPRGDLLSPAGAAGSRPTD